VGKLLFWIAVIGVVWIAIKFAQASARRVERSAREARERGEGGDAGPKAGRGGAPRGELMVRCAHCGVHLPQSDAVSAGALHYCSGAHRDAGPKAR
jgi:uncharacterized protein